jgi:hypothetical protein
MLREKLHSGGISRRRSERNLSAFMNTGRLLVNDGELALTMSGSWRGARGICKITFDACMMVQAAAISRTQNMEWQGDVPLSVRR